MKQKKVNVRQGDLLFIPTERKNGYHTDISTPERKKQVGYREDGIIQEGEATGHHHRIDPSMGQVFRPKWGQAFVVTGPQPVTVTHGGSPDVDPKFHAPKRLEANTTYDVHIAREFDPILGERRVMD